MTGSNKHDWPEINLAISESIEPKPWVAQAKPYLGNAWVEEHFDSYKARNWLEDTGPLELLVYLSTKFHMGVRLEITKESSRCVIYRGGQLQPIEEEMPKLEEAIVLAAHGAI